VDRTVACTLARRTVRDRSRYRKTFGKSAGIYEYEKKRAGLLVINIKMYGVHVVLRTQGDRRKYQVSIQVRIKDFGNDFRVERYGKPRHASFF